MQNRIFTRLARLGLMFGMCFLAGCGTLTETEVTPDDVQSLRAAQNVDLDTEVEHLVKPMVDTGYTPGIEIGVLLPDGSMHFYGYGEADQETHLKPGAATLFPAGSLSKGFLAAMTSKMVSDGKLSWDDTLEKLLPPGTVLSEDAKHVTLRQMATHTAGFPRQPITLQTLTYFVEYLFNGESFYRHIDHDYIIKYLADFEAEDPGTIQYSNIGYGLLSYILEYHTGKTIDQLLAENITGPLHLMCTGYDPSALPCNAEHAHGYAGDSPKFIPRGDPTPDWEFTQFMRGAASIHSTAHDLLTFASAHLHGDSPLNKILAGDLKMRVSEPDGGIGIGWSIDEVDGGPINYEIGLVAGYTSYMGIDPIHKTAVVVLQNAFNWDSSVGHKMLVYLRTAQIAGPPTGSSAPHAPAPSH